MTKPKLLDVARAAKVGTTTVSRVLNNRPNISERTRQRVLGAIETLGYTPNLNARSFRSGQTCAVSVLLPMTGTAFYETLLTAVYGALADQGYDMALFPLLGSTRVRRHREPSALMYRADALLIASQNPDDLYGGPSPFQNPTVLVDAHHPRYHSVSFDNLAAGRMAAEYALSFRWPLVFLDGADQAGVPSSPVFAERRSGILRTLAEYGVRPVLTLSVPTSHEGLRDAARRLLESRPEGPFFVLAMSDDLALGLHRWLQDAGLHLGPDYRMLGFDGSESALAAGIASVVQPVREMGEFAAQVLLRAMRGELPGLIQHVFPPILTEGISFT